jgi:hypothetical protein
MSGYKYDACPSCGGPKDLRSANCFGCRDSVSLGIRAAVTRRAAYLNGGFWRKVDKSAGPEGCWPWTGARQSKDPRYPNRGGYGSFLLDGRTRYAHRHVLEVTLGRQLAPGEIAMHSCDNPPCVNPAHLRPGTKADNVADMVAKGRHAHGPGRRRPVAA